MEIYNDDYDSPWKDIYMKHSRTLWITFSFIMILIFLNACSSAKKRLETNLLMDQNKTLAVVSALKDKSLLPETFKGLGKIKLWNKDKIEINEYIAWAGMIPEKFRLLIRNISGFALADLACDGEFVYFLLHNGFHKKPLSEIKNWPIFSISIKPNDILILLSGGVPIEPHKTATLFKKESGQGYELILKRSFGRIVQKIYLDKDLKNVEHVQVFDSLGLRYSAKMLSHKMNNRYKIPSSVIISNKTMKLELNVNGFWPDVPVLESTFVLSKDENK